jgi:hypothetical protein
VSALAVRPAEWAVIADAIGAGARVVYLADLDDVGRINALRGTSAILAFFGSGSERTHSPDSAVWTSVNSPDEPPACGRLQEGLGRSVFIRAGQPAGAAPGYRFPQHTKCGLSHPGFA